jgi:signal transduction histidine kinase/ActR/RegA family two-component response regulator
MSAATPRDDPGVRLPPRLLALAGLLLAGVLILTLVVLVQRTNNARDRALAHKQHSFNVVVTTSEVDGSLARAEAALGRYVTDGRPDTGTLYYDEWRRAGQGLDALRDLVADNPDEAARADALKQLYLKRGRELDKPATLASYKRGWAALALYSQAGRSDVLPQMRKLLRAIADEERSLLDARTTAAAESVDQSDALSVWLSVVGLVLILLLGGIGWFAIDALAQQRLSRAVADAEENRSAALEIAVDARTLELSEANRQLVEAAQVREEAEAKLRQMQKLEAVGQLTGGIAHDFNNMLAVVLGGLELAKKRVEEQAAEAGRHIDNAMDGATRAAELTRRLLSFSRAEPLLAAAIDPAGLIAGMIELIDRTIGERIEVQVEIAAQLWAVRVDPFQLENAILNLCVNARDAMDASGLLRIEARNTALAAQEIGELAAGDYVAIAVIDHGRGMSRQLLERVFEPFFTTKPVGEGTGLGLSQIFGFARQSGGDVQIASTEGVGTTATLYLPRHHGRVAAGAAVDDQAIAPGGGAKLLVVEDDVRVRAATGEALTELGYRPLLCDSAEDAAALLASHPDIALLVTDVVMPRLTGPELVEQLQPAHPDLPVLFVTGYVGEAGEAGQFAGYKVLRKPFTMKQLGRAVAEAMAGVSA